MLLAEYPPIDELIPHRGTMRLLDCVLAFEPGADGGEGASATAEYTPQAGAWYADANGDMPAWIGLELMAQTVAVLVALAKRRAGLPPKMGVLLGTRAYQASAVAFAQGRALRIRAETLLADSSGLAAYACAVEAGGKALASATLKVFEPEDFDQFAEGSRS